MKAKGLFKIIDTYGYPLEMALSDLYQENIFPDWKEFIRDAISSGWTYDQTFRKIWHAARDVYGPEFEEFKWAIPATYLLVMEESYE